jgi:pimeloyl-ACP methyl ester carboxylesterase
MSFRRLLISVTFVAFLIASLYPPAVTAQPPLPQAPVPPDSPAAPMACEPDGTQASGAIYRICMPALLPWNGELIVYAHGYVAASELVGLPEDQMTLPGGIPISTLITLDGYAFAATSYSSNGLAVKEGLADLVDLVDIFAQTKGEPNAVYLAGVSEGGLITALSVEQHPDVFDGGLAMCGPVGGFDYQVNHVGDFRAVFDYFFPGLLPGDAVAIPESLIEGWEAYYESTIQPQLQDPANADKVTQLLTVTGAGWDPGDPSTKEETVRWLLWFNVVGTNDAVDKLGGQPFDNLDRLYAGSDDDAALNAGVARFGADQAALDEMAAHYTPSGQLSVPLVTLHTTGDEVVPYGHELRYQATIAAAGSAALHENRSVDRFGHCNFTEDEVWDAFLRLEEMVKNPPPPPPTSWVYLPLVLVTR